MPSPRPIAIVLTAIAFAPLSTLAKQNEAPPEISPEGLQKIAKPKEVDTAYVRPGVDFSTYQTVKLLEPQISFRKDWQRDQNTSRSMGRITDADMAKMVATGKKLFLEEFNRVLKKKGYTVVEEISSDTLVVRPAITNLDIFAPDPNNRNGIWNKVYTDGAGEATLAIELYDGPSNQILARAYDHKDGRGMGASWRMPRTRATNISDARNALNDWAHALVKGLERAKAQSTD